MLTQSDVRKRAVSAVFHKGLELSNFGRVKEFEYSIYTVNDIPVADISAVVHDFDESVYKVSVTVDEEYDDISESTCNCDEIFRVDGLCRHCVALLTEYLKQRKAKEVLDVKWKKESSIQRGYFEQTQAGLKDMIQRYRQTDSAGFQLPAQIVNKVSLQPYMTFITRKLCSMEFKIALTQPYVVKNISVFLNAVAHAQEVSYGKNLEFFHTMNAFDERSRQMIQLLLQMQRDQYRVSFSKYGNPSYQPNHMERSIDIEEMFMDACFELLRNSSIHLSYQFEEEVEWWISEEICLPHLLLEGTANGLFVTLQTTDFLYGANRYYILDKDTRTIRFCRKELKEEIGDFLEYLLDENFHRAFIAVSDLAAFCKTMIPYIKLNFEVSIHNFDEKMYLPEQPEFELYLDKSSKNVVAARLMAVYSKDKYNVLNLEDGADYRNIKEEAGIKSLVGRFFDSSDTRKTLFMTKDEEAIYELLYSGLVVLNEKMSIFASDAFSKMKIHSAPNVSVGLSLKSNLLEFSVDVEGLPMEELSHLLAKYDRKKHYIRLKNGDFLNLGQEDGIEALASIKDALNLSETQIKNGSIALPAYRSLFLDTKLKSRVHLAVEKNK